MINEKQNVVRLDSRPSLNQPPTIKQYPLERRKIAKKLTVAMISWTIFLGICLIITTALSKSITTDSSIFRTISLCIITLYIIIFMIQLWYQNQYYKRYFYNIATDFLVIKKGVIMPHETMLPYEKLQDVYMDQDLFDRIFNLWDVHVSTATAMSGHEAHIDGVNRENAEKLRELILNKIRKQR
jgi:membrane protein YdbS with pleckstrin-like domain